MTLIKSISGIRGTMGGAPGDSLTPPDIVKFVSAYAAWTKSGKTAHKPKIVVGRDARISGPMVNSLVIATLTSMGCDVVDIGLASTPTTEIAVQEEAADGGIIITASHNPRQWNALKLLNERGEFISASDGETILQLADEGAFLYAEIDALGTITTTDYTQKHIDKVLSLDLVDKMAIAASRFTVAVDAVNSVGGIVLPALLKALGVKEVVEINCEPNGHFAHNPEPLAEHLAETCSMVRQFGVDVGFVTDPDADRLAIVCEDGSLFGEEYTLVAIADYILSLTPGATVSNLSSTRALRDVAGRYGCTYTAAAVGEVNVVEKMKEVNAVIGGEGNGGVIYPASHYGRDALVGVALFLTHLAHSGKTVSALRKTYPAYHMSKNKIEFSAEVDVDFVLQRIAEIYSGNPVNTIDGVKIDFETSWIHLRKSNTEPIVRVYIEATTAQEAARLSDRVMHEIMQAAKKS